jgi:molecular chaperone DnaK (HSP70)
LKPQYVIGIDLGTTNCALAFAEAGDLDPRSLPSVQQFSIPQLANPGELREESLLPSSLYLHAEADFPEGAVALPWDTTPSFVVGELAKRRGVEAPRRLVVSAKSWLSHSGVDRTAPILPTSAPEGVARMSPVRQHGGCSPPG